VLAFVCSSVFVPPLRKLLFALRNFILIYSLSFRLCVCALECLLIDSLEFYDGSIFYFVDLVGAPGQLDIRSFWGTFIYVSKLLLSPLFFGGFVPFGTFYASAI
jgi:hypothetical protein